MSSRIESGLGGILVATMNINVNKNDYYLHSFKAMPVAETCVESIDENN